MYYHTGLSHNVNVKKVLSGGLGGGSCGVAGLRGSERGPGRQGLGRRLSLAVQTGRPGCYTFQNAELDNIFEAKYSRERDC